MTKVISLSDKAYNELKKRKNKGESFSEVVIRILENKKSGSLLKFAGLWSGEEFEEVVRTLKSERENAISREYQV